MHQHGTDATARRREDQTAEPSPVLTEISQPHLAGAPRRRDDCPPAEMADDDDREEVVRDLLNDAPGG